MTYSLRRSEERTTLTLDIAMAAEAIQGWRTTPRGMKMPESTNNVHKTGGVQDRLFGF